mmetsp:Transcript_4662/g.15546  ORF Transcript_4662/g.15546 Transcript_4662/m.15546 type:complete len:216 (-) Transcript_4662:517-1164(-)
MGERGGRRDAKRAEFEHGDGPGRHETRLHKPTTRQAHRDLPRKRSATRVAHETPSGAAQRESVFAEGNPQRAREFELGLQRQCPAWRARVPKVSHAPQQPHHSVCVPHNLPPPVHRGGRLGVHAATRAVGAPGFPGFTNRRYTTNRKYAIRRAPGASPVPSRRVLRFQKVRLPGRSARSRVADTCWAEPPRHVKIHTPNRGLRRFRQPGSRRKRF